VKHADEDALAISDYLTKEPLAAVRWARSKGARSFRPVRFSTKWEPFGLTAARKGLREVLGLPALEGPFVRVLDGPVPSVLARAKDPAGSMLKGLRP
jgi:hypothetical protein